MGIKLTPTLQWGVKVENLAILPENLPYMALICISRELFYHNLS
jgi:hypothetical protein